MEDSRNKYRVKIISDTVPQDNEGNTEQEETRNLCSYLEDDDDWKAYLDQPLPTDDLSGLKPDRGSSSTLGVLYDFYKVPKEKRILPEANEISHASNSKIMFEEKQIGVPRENLNEIIRSSSEIDNKPHFNRSSNLIAVSRPDVTNYFMTSSIFQKEKHNNDSMSLQKDPNHIDSIQIESKEQFSNHLHYNATPSGINYNLPDLLLTPNNPRVFLATKQSRDLFDYTIEAPKSLKQKDGDPPMTYINKGQFYCITLCSNKLPDQETIENGLVTSIVQVVFGKSKPEDEQLRHWNYWHSRQHTAKQRIIDIADYKESNMIYNIDEFAYNAIAFNWNCSDQAKIFVTCNCLSTDFSSQKGVKGLPLILQIDTFSNINRTKNPVHRGVCQLKIFCDKGAERKIRDEERKAKKKREKKELSKSASQSSLEESENSVSSFSDVSIPSSESETVNNNSLLTSRKQDVVRFLSSDDLTTKAFHYNPDTSANSRNQTSQSTSSRKFSADIVLKSRSTTPACGEEELSAFSNHLQLDELDSLRISRKRSGSDVSVDDGDLEQTKISRLLEPEPHKNVLMYIRTEQDVAFDGLMLDHASLNGLKEALQQKYNIPAEKIRRLLKKSKKGILVNIDDNIVSHYSNECTFIISVQEEVRNNETSYSVILTDV